MRPVVTLLGAGPGDPELLTVKAVKALRRATVALVDDLVDPGVLRYLKRSARIIPVGKRGGCASTPQAFIHKLMVAEALKGEQVVRIKGGDPFVFGRGGEECDALRDAGIDVEVVSGLTAGIAGPAALGIPVTDRRCAPGVALVTGHAQDGGHGPDWPALARSGLTLVVYMGVARVGAIVDGLRSGGLPASTPVAVISAAHTPRQRQALTTLDDLVATVQREQLSSPALLVVGVGVVLVGRLVEGQHRQRRQQVIDSLGQRSRTLAPRAEAKFAGHDDAGEHRIGPHVRKPLRQRAGRVADQIGQRVGVQQPGWFGHQRSARSCGGRSSTSGTPSSSGVHDASKSSNRFFRMGVRMSRSPSLRISTSVPSSSNSRGMRTA